MRLQAFLLQEGRTMKIGDEALSIIRKKCGKHVRKILAQSRPSIYRGMRKNFGYGIIDPKSSPERRSSNTSNHTTLLMDNLPSWKGYPKRSQSIICSTQLSYARSYGYVYYIYPSDACKFGVVDSGDVWGGFYKAFGVGDTSRLIGVETFNKLLSAIKIKDKTYSGMKSDLIRYFEIDTIRNFNKMKDETDKSSEDIIHELSYIYNDRRDIPLLYSFIKEHLTLYSKTGNGLTIIDHLNKYMSPKYNKFKNKAPSMNDVDNEVWVGNAPIVLVNIDNKFDLIKEDLL